MGSSITSKLYGFNKSLHNDTLALSPPERTLIFLETSSLVNRKEPKIVLGFVVIFSEIASSIVSKIVDSSSRKSA